MRLVPVRSLEVHVLDLGAVEREDVVAVRCAVRRMVRPPEITAGGAENIFPHPKLVLAVLVVVGVSGHYYRLLVGLDEVKDLRRVGISRKVVVHRRMEAEHDLVVLRDER